MSSKIETREFSINDYGAAVEIWQRVEGVEIAEGDDRESVAQFLARNWGLSRAAVDGPATVGLRRAGLKRAIIMVADKNPRGREFWRRTGWEEIPGAIAMGIDL
ncbi:MAG: hypothetical protein DME85_04275 [Verrucomicrobia bacterium]|nr:MAG: hypothetical protein DME85_04275 [Verrucomicrobiota bacterium]